MAQFELLPLPKTGDSIGGGAYRLVEELGRGTFGFVWLASVCRGAQGEVVAVKFESKIALRPQLAHEYKQYGLLSGGAGFPRVGEAWVGAAQNKIQCDPGSAPVCQVPLFTHMPLPPSTL